MSRLLVSSDDNTHIAEILDRDNGGENHAYSVCPCGWTEDHRGGQADTIEAARIHVDAEPAVTW